MSTDLSISSLYNIKGKIALVTGGGSGIGKMIAEGLAKNGAKVYIAARKEAQLKAAAEEINKTSAGKVDYIVANIASKAGVDALIAEFRKRESKLHILVNNSGITWGAPFDNFPEAKGWDNIFAVNVKSIFYMTSGLADLLEKDSTNVDPARVINISSVAGIEAESEGSLSDAGNGVWSYNTSKAAVNHLTSQLAITLVRRHINVNAILPGLFPSKMTAFGFKTVGSDNFASAQPTGRYGHTEDMAGTALFLVSPASAHVTGNHIILDGGSRLLAQRVTGQVKL
ncbi:hypothetical protein EYR40_001525 [Pleurotus pulmonarius]|nr:hypothetical protein EYR36_000120 [Pleurotus pulmonarius]KAF4604346.1 hypothetical protein EYR38_004768 [Pleurotus pulmonarius]KAF4609172.1 hypothetical protein EYR40_001525 [Pleurotus pulmonarius]